ncbi:unnamed protein product [Psylliodes chrysocephalus]|uniref:Uncharacterized protein n=1 Tax=Psylliodes chrysocephalus TaxID=3402493 RepID=A0A9P0CK48_9CUCU|nr:unnamed protein product [Psylliodes chrysocephala]
MSDTTSNPTHPGLQRSLNFNGLKQHVISHKIDCGLWLIRVFAIIFSLAYFIPIFGNSYNYYYKVLLANAAISALRLHQRLGPVQFNRQFLAQLLTEDSCHYLFYSLMFLYVAPVSLVLVPILLFCILHSASYSLTLLDTLGQNSWWGARLLISLVEFQSLNILKGVAFTEIFLMPYTVFLIILGRASLLTPFIYYQFLSQRYASRRNPYTRSMFRELRVLFERTASKPSLPSFVKQFLMFIVNFTTKLAPQHYQAPQGQQQQ